jgi:integrase
MGIWYDKQKKRYAATVGSGKQGTRIKKLFQLKRDAEYWHSEQIRRMNSLGHHYTFNEETQVIDMIDQYLKALQDKTPDHQRAVQRGITDILNELGIVFFKDLSKQKVHRYRNVKNLSPRTINKKMGYVKSMCKHLYNEGWIHDDPMKGLEKKKSTKIEKRALDKREMGEILRVAKERSPDHWFPIIFTGFILALRKGELLTLEWSDIDFENKKVHIRDKPHLVIEGQPHRCKWGSSRVLPLFPELEQLLHGLHQKSNFIFPNYKGGMKWFNINRDFPKSFKGANIDRPEEVTPHTLRHTRISQLLCYEKSNPLEVKISPLLGATHTFWVAWMA